MVGAGIPIYLPPQTLWSLRFPSPLPLLSLGLLTQSITEEDLLSFGCGPWQQTYVAGPLIPPSSPAHVLPGASCLPQEAGTPAHILYFCFALMFCASRQRRIHVHQ